MARRKKIRVAMPAWEIGRVQSGLGVKVGGLGVVVEELPPELVKAAAAQNIKLEVETLTPCFAHYDKSRLTKIDMHLPVTVDGYSFDFELYEHIFPDGQKVVYFWDEWQLSWTNAGAIYPTDPQVQAVMYAAMGQAMAGYIRQGRFNAVHLHDYHVGLIPFYLGDDYLAEIKAHFTIHNASYQGVIPLTEGGYSSLDRLNLSGEKLFHKYFDFFDNLNIMKACLLKVYETGGKITTVSGDITGTWGYAAELKESRELVWAKAYTQKGSPPGEIFVPNRHLDLFEKIPVAGITNGIAGRNRAENLPELKADILKEMDSSVFQHPVTQAEMLANDHNFDADSLYIKADLKRLLHLETFGTEPYFDPILITVVGRLVEQKNLGLVVDIIERSIAYDSGVKFIILASPQGDDGQAEAAKFQWLADKYPKKVYFNSSFNLPLSKLIMAGGDFCLIPSRYEPCGLVDYEAALLGNIPIARATGGLTKLRDFAYIYEWLDISDRAGEATAFFTLIKDAIDTYRKNPARHTKLMRTAINIDASWDVSAGQYVKMYRYGMLVKNWKKERQKLISRFVKSLKDERDLFAEFFVSGQKEYGDKLDWELKEEL